MTCTWLSRWRDHQTKLDKNNGLLLKVIPRNKPHAYHETISFSFGPCLYIVKVRIASIQGNFLSHAFRLFVFAKKCSVLIGSNIISFPYLLKCVHSSTTKGKRFCDEKSWKYYFQIRNERKTHVTHSRQLIGCKGWESAMDTRPCKKYLWERHFSNHRNVWSFKMSWLDRVQDTQRRETTNHTQDRGVAF